MAMSSVLRDLPVVTIDYVFVDPDLRDSAISWLNKHRQEVIRIEEGKSEQT